jgi:glycosyltransferase involved in cell wall biosynthesis
MISAVVLSKNEEKNIRDCLESLVFVDEILVIDDYSSDDTVKIAKKMGTKVLIRSLDDNWAQQRNFAMKFARGDWILFIDADERVPEKLAKEIKDVVANPRGREGFYFRRRDYIWGKTLGHGETGAIRLLRLGRKGIGRWKRRVHETWVIEGATGCFKTPLDHHPHQSLREFVRDINRMSTLHARENYEEGKRSGVVKVLVMPIAHFVFNYFFRRGFFDGIHGFVVALLMSLHSFLSWSKLWLMQKRLSN